MRRHNFIEKWKPVLVFTGILAVMVVLCLLGWLLSGGDGDSVSSTTTATVATEDTGWPGEDTTDTSVPEDTQLPNTETMQPSEPDLPPSTGTTDPPTSVIPQQNRLSCDKIAIFSGRFVEDGSDKPAENVVSLLITNRSDEFLDMATIQYKVDGKTATFVVSGLPARESCWVMEYTGMTMTEDSSVEYVGCTTSFRKDAVDQAYEITISADGNLLSARNNTTRTLKNVFIYYKSVHTDGNYFGGITYMVNFGDLEPGEIVEKLGGHYLKDESKIVRIGWQ